MLPIIVAHDLSRSYREATIITILGYVSVVPRLYVRISGSDAEVLFDWTESIVADKQAFAAMVALEGACDMIPRRAAPYQQRARDLSEMRLVAAQEHSRLMRIWSNPSDKWLVQPDTPDIHAFLAMVSSLVKAQWNVLSQDKSFERCVEEVRNRLFAQQVLGRDELSKIADWVSNQSVDPISLVRGYETLAIRGTLEGFVFP